MNTRRIGLLSIAALLIVNAVGAAMLWQAWQQRHNSGKLLSAIDRPQELPDKGQLHDRQLGVSPFERTSPQARKTHPIKQQ